jgi:predicted outer membrane repeat protein
MQSIELLESRIAPAVFIVTSLNDAGEGSLREAVGHANDHEGADLIVFEKGLEGTVNVTGGQIRITDTLTIKGPGAGKLILDANLNSRIFLAADLDAEKDSPLTVSGLTFYRGFQDAPDGAGGAIASLESLNVRGCVFLENQAEGIAANFSGGGAIFVSNAADLSNVPLKVDIRESTFVGNRAIAGSGGAVNAEVDGGVNLVNNVFSDNVAHDVGGAVNLRAGLNKVLLVDKCRFYGNSASQVGAASLIGSDTGGDNAVIVRGSLFAGNSATNVEAGALGINGGDVLIEKTSFTQNTATGEGGALDAKGYSSLVIRSSRFLDNAARAGGPDSGGGGLHLDMPAGALTRVMASIVSGNSAKAGGGILAEGGSGRLEIIGSRISNNDSAEIGGGILVLAQPVTNDSVDLSIIRSKITGNDSEDIDEGGGGVFFAGDGKFTMQQSQVIDNTGFRLGGGLLLINTETATITGSLIANNTAFGAGGGIWADGPIKVSTTKILGNAADVGGGLLGTKSIELNFCVVSGNFAGGGGGLAHATGIEPVLNRTKIVRNFSVDGQQISEV